TGGDTEDHPDHGGTDGQGEGDRDPVLQLRPHLDVALEGVPEAGGVAVGGVRAELVVGAHEQALDVVPVLDVDGLVEAQVLLDGGDGRGVGVLAYVLGCQLVGGLAAQLGDQEEDGEGDCADHQQQYQCAEDASDDVRSHSCPAPGG